MGSAADLQRIGPHGAGDILELLVAEIDEFLFQLVAHLAIGVFREANAARLANAFETRGDIDAVAHQVAVGLLDHVAQMDADTELDAALRRQARVALDHAVLHLDRAAHGVDHAAELDEDAVAGPLDDAPVMRGDGGVDEVAAQPSQTRQGAILVRAREPAVADDIRDQDRRDLPGLAHSSGSPALRRPSNSGRNVGAWYQPFDSEFGIEAAGFRQGGLRLFHLAFERIGGGQIP